MRDKIITDIENSKIIVIVRDVAKDKLIPLAEAVYAGGIRLLEITYDAKGCTPDEETAKNIEMLATHFDQRLHIGAGTVVTEKQVELTKKAGGSFILSPDTYDAVISKTRELEMVSIPGALTPTEIQAAHRYGADFVKLFPVTNLGTEYVKVIKPPLSHIKMLAVGGITQKSMAEYFNAGVCGFAIGSDIVKKDLIENNDFEKITELAKAYTNITKKLCR